MADNSWVSAPEHSNEVAVENTGRSWDEWVAVIDAGPGRNAGHKVIAAWVGSEFGLAPWWAQNVTVSFERITGLRVPGQMADGTFTVNRSRVMFADRSQLRSFLLDDAARAALIPKLDSALISRPASRNLRFALTRAGEPLGVLTVTIDDAALPRLRVTATHEKLPSLDAAEPWRAHWGAWLEDLEKSFRPD